MQMLQVSILLHVIYFAYSPDASSYIVVVEQSCKCLANIIVSINNESDSSQYFFDTNNVIEIIDILSKRVTAFST